MNYTRGQRIEQICEDFENDAAEHQARVADKARIRALEVELAGVRDELTAALGQIEAWRDALAESMPA